MPVRKEAVDKSRDDVIAATATALERLVEVISLTTSRETIMAAHLPAAQGRLIASLIRFSADREGKS